MAASSVVCEDQFQCSICLDVFTDPVSTPCGHNFCMICLMEFWDSSSQCECPLCKEEFPQRPELRVNTFIKGLAAPFKKSVQEKMSTFTENSTKLTVQEMILERLKKIEELKYSAEVNKKNAEQEKAYVLEIFSSLKCHIERNQADLLKMMEEKQETAKKQAEDFIKNLEKEIMELRRINPELEQLSHTEDPLHFFQISLSLCSPPNTKDWTDVRIPSHLSVKNLSRALAQLQKILTEEMEKLLEQEVRGIQQYAVDVILDRDTAHFKLILSDDGKQVKYGDKRQKLYDNPGRFDRHFSVLGKEGFSSGRFYYEVQVRGKTEWILGVATESITRKGVITASPKAGYWIVYMKNENKYEALESSIVTLSLKQAPQKVGVFVDYEDGLVSFYDVDAKSLIYSFTGQTFTEKLYPLFNPCNSDRGSLIIRSV